MTVTSPTLRPWLSGILFVALLALAAFSMAQWPTIENLRLSPLIVGILVGILYANTLRTHLPTTWLPGVLFSSKTILRWGVILFGFRVTFQQIADVGFDGLSISLIMVTTTFCLGAFFGQKVLKLDRDTALLTTMGSAVCGAAAILATEPVLKADPYKSAVAVGTVVIFGTLSLFLYPLMQATGILHLTPTAFGLFTGGTIHEVAQVIGAAAPVGDEAMRVAVIVKMTRVMLLAPLLIVVGLTLSMMARKKGVTANPIKVTIPWFVLGFLAISGVHSTGIVPEALVSTINTVDTFFLTMAMTALGMETPWSKFRQAGFKPILLALFLYGWLTVGGYAITRGVVALAG